MELMRRAEFLEHMRESRLVTLSDWQMNERDLVRARAAMGQKCQQWAAEIKKARKERPDEADDSWSVLEDTGTLQVIRGTGEAIEEQALEEQKEHNGAWPALPRSVDAAHVRRACPVHSR